MKSTEVHTLQQRWALRTRRLIGIRQTQKGICCMIPLTRSLQNQHIHGDRKETSDLWGWGAGIGAAANESKAALWGDENVPESDSSHGCTAL